MGKWFYFCRCYNFTVFSHKLITVNCTELLMLGHYLLMGVAIFDASLQGALKTWLLRRLEQHAMQIRADLEHITLSYEKVSFRQPQEK